MIYIVDAANHDSRIQWSMHDKNPKPEDAYFYKDKDKNIYIETKVTNDQLDTILNPNSDWILVYNSDDRCMKDDRNYDNEVIDVTREFLFKKNATLREVFNKIASGPCYGYFEGIKFLNKYEHKSFYHQYDKYKNLPVYEFCFGT
jgi:hypothetical protein